MLCPFVHIIDEKIEAWRGFVHFSRSHRQLVWKLEFYTDFCSRKQTFNQSCILERGEKKSCILKGNGRKCITIKENMNL